MKSTFQDSCIDEIPKYFTSIKDTYYAALNAGGDHIKAIPLYFDNKNMYIHKFGLNYIYLLFQT